MRWMGSANTSLQFLRSVTGISSGPEAALGLISSMASIMSVFVNSRISSVKGYSIKGDGKAALSIVVFVGSLNTDKNCFWSKVAISLELEWISPFSSNNVVILLFFLENFFAYSRVAYIYVRSRAKCLKFRTTTSKINTLGKPLMQQKYYFIQEM